MTCPCRTPLQLRPANETESYAFEVSPVTYCANDRMRKDLSSGKYVVTFDVYAISIEQYLYQLGYQKVLYVSILFALFFSKLFIYFCTIFIVIMSIPLMLALVLIWLLGYVYNALCYMNT